MRRLGLALLIASSCTRDLKVPEAPPPASPGTVQGRTVYATPGMSERLPAPGASISVLGTSIATTSKADGTFLLEGVVSSEGSLLFRFDSDGNGSFDRQRLLTLEAIGAGPGRDLALGDVALSENARLHGKTLRGDVPGRGGHGGTVAFVPEGPFTTYTNDDGTYLLRDLPEGTIRITFFRVGYVPRVLDGIALRSGEDFAVADVELDPAMGVQESGSITTRVTFSPSLADATGTTVVAYDVVGSTFTGTVGVAGDVTIAAVPAGVYTVAAARQDYFPAALQNVLVTAGSLTLAHDLTLQRIGSTPFDGGGLIIPDAGMGFDAGTCVQGASCPIPSSCTAGVLDCRPAGALCVAAGPAPDGTSCGSGLTCRGGTCTSGCATSGVCQLMGLPCRIGTLTCVNGLSSCVDTMLAYADGTGCGIEQVCSGGACVPCRAGVACPIGLGSCQAGITNCSTGAARCIDSGLSLANGASCGPGMVCNLGACTACIHGGGCQPAANRCHAGTLDCTSGVGLCNDTGNAAANGASCGTNQVCFNGACSACTSGAACVPPANPCRLGSTDCSTGQPVCQPTGNVTEGTPCTGGTCRIGQCSPPGNVVGIFNGDGQAAGPDQLLGAPVVLQVVNDAGTALAGVAVTVVPPPGAIAQLSSPTTDGAGRVSLTLRLGRALGPQTFVATAPGAPAPLDIHTTAVQVDAGVIYTLVNLGRTSGSVLYDAGTAGVITSPDGVAVARDGTVYFTMVTSQYVMKLSPEGMLSVVAGQGSCGSSGDNGLATSASLCTPTGIAIDEQVGMPSILYFSDGNAARIRSINLTTGIITTYAGGGSSPAPLYGDFGPATAAALSAPGQLSLGPESPPWLYIADTSHLRVRRVDPVSRFIFPFVSSGGGGCIAGQQRLMMISCDTGTGCAVAFDAQGNAFVSGNFCGTDLNSTAATPAVVRVPLDGGEWGVVAGYNSGGSGEGINGRRALVARAPALAVDPAGNLYLGPGTTVRRVDGPTATITTVVGNLSQAGSSGDYGRADQALLTNVWGMVFDPVTRRDLYFSDGNTIRVVRGLGQTSSTRAQLSAGGPTALACFVDQIAGGVSALLVDGASTPLSGYEVAFVGFTDGGSILPSTLTGPNGVATVVPRVGLLPVEHVFSASFEDIHGVPAVGSPVVFRVDARRPDAGTVFTVVNETGTAGSDNSGQAAPAMIRDPTGLAGDDAGNVYFSEMSGNRVMRLQPDGLLGHVAGVGGCSTGGDQGPARLAGLCTPRGIAFDSARGRLYIADGNSNRVRAVELGPGIITTVAGGGVQTMAPWGDGLVATSAILATPTHVRVVGDALYIADDQHVRVRRVDLTTNIITTVLAQGACTGAAALSSCGQPRGCDVAADSNGALYVSGVFCGTDFGGGLSPTPGVARLETNGSLTHIAGLYNGTSGDDVPAAAALFQNAPSLAFDAQGRLLLVLPHAVRAIDFSTGRLKTLGGSTAGFAGNYAPFSTAAQFNNPYDVVSIGGHLFISDTNNNALRMVW